MNCYVEIIEGSTPVTIVEIPQSAGPIGPQGPEGAQGAQGIQGPIGLTGPQGVAGEQGIQGLTGLTGPQGVAGAQGPVGAQGVQGPIGAQGIPGIAGSPGYYGAFEDISNQIILDVTQSYTMQLGITSSSNGVQISDGSKIYFSYAGVYNIQFSAQIVNPESNVYNAYIWLSKNGENVTNSCGEISVPQKHGGVNGAIIAAWNYVLPMLAGDYAQVMWSAEHENIALNAISVAPIMPFGYYEWEDPNFWDLTPPAGSSLLRPLSPSVIVTATQVAPG